MFGPALAPYTGRVKRIGIVVLWISACGGGDGGVSIPIDEVEARGMDALCGYQVRCGFAPDKAACDETQTLKLQNAADVKAGRILYDGKAAATCLDVYRTLSCKLSEAGTTSLAQAQTCYDVFKGTVAAGGACLTDEECQSQDCDKAACTESSTCCAGTCVAKIAAGGDCSAAGSQCADDLFCKRGTTAGTARCTELVADGQPCTRTDFCVVGRRCNQGTCGFPPAHGQACPDLWCDSLEDVCDPASKICVARIAVGGDCAGNPTGCMIYANCDAGTMKCVARKRAGEPCAQSTDCLLGVACTGGVCVPPPDPPVCM